jgi:flagellin-like hook-associated protein FlgL
MRGIISAMKGVVDEALASSSSSDRAVSGKQFNELLVQLADLASDGSYKGVSLLKSNQSNATSGGTETFTVQFNEDFDDSTLEINGVNVTGNSSMAIDEFGEINAASNMSGASTGTLYAVSFNEQGQSTGEAIGIRSAEVHTTTETSALAADASGGGGTFEIAWVDDSSYQVNLQTVISDLEAFDSALINTAKSLSQNVNIVSLRQDFTLSMINTLESGADKLTLADLNEEGANLLALQTSQSLGIQSLSLASQSQQAVLQLLG